MRHKSLFPFFIFLVIDFISLLKTTFKNNLKHIVLLISDFNGSQNKTC